MKKYLIKRESKIVTLSSVKKIFVTKPLILIQNGMKKGEDLTHGCLLDYEYYRLIANDLSRQRELDADL